MENIQKEFLPYAVLFMTVSIGIELWFSRRRGASNYDGQESFISAVIFVLGTVVNGMFRLISGAVLVFAYQHSLFEIKLSPIVQFGAVFLLVEFFYYWMHRYSHRVRLGWATHIVHHSPECYNLSIAYRLGFTGFFSLLWVFYIPIAWLGFDPKIIAGMASINLLYQFWLHTELIPKLGPLELLLNTPSHHRVHHGSNPLYLDRNYGGTLIIFDRLFGTFQAEEPKVKIEYGLVEKITNKSVGKILFLGWTNLWKDVRQQRSLYEKIRIVFSPPGWTPGGGTTSEAIRSQWIQKNIY